MRWTPATLSPLRWAVVICAVVIGLGACGSGTAPPGALPSSAPLQSAPATVDPAEELVAHGLLMQDSASSPVELCLGGVAESYPPQCGGPRVVGDVDWDALRPERASGVTWTNSEVWAVGRFDAGVGDAGSLVLTRPLSLTPPPGVSVPSASPMSFPQLCEAPYAGGGSPGAGSPEEQARLSERLAELDGYIGSWVSDGSSMFNVLVTGDAGRARAELRKVWSGGLCVEQRDFATEADVRAAQEALSAAIPGLLSSGGDAVHGTLEVQVVLLDAETRDRILATVRPWLRDRDVRITGAFLPLDR